MERNFNNEDFEDFLKFKTDHYKLYPSEKVWKGIHQSLHTRKKWLRIGGSFLFLTTLLFVSYQFNDRSAASVANVQPSIKSITVSGSTKTNKPANNKLIAGSKIKSAPPSKAEKQFVPPLTSSTTNASDVTTQNTLPFFPAETIAMVLPGNTTEQEEMDTEVIDENQVAEEIAGSTEIAVAEMTEAAKAVHDRSEGNWLQEMAAIKLASARRHRLNLQFYFSPTIGYRKLTDGDKSKELANVPLATNQLGVNNFVDHKPAIGLELGSNVLFSPSKKLTLKTGLQLNYSRYTIKAYKFYFEKANIALVTSGRIADTMSSYTSLRNFNGYFPEELQNQYLKLSLPIGAEYKLIGNKRLQLNIAGSVQPSYLLYNDTYLLSTDFINYTKEPTLVRKWNFNTSAEAFVSYYIGGMRWQVGPQFRYQTLSSYNDRYPIKEYLIEYGVKFGVSKTLR